jgi:drug/metabolite transporter (DMT)-like permease
LLLNYSLPLFLPLVERFWLRTPVSPKTWKPLLIGLLGLVCILKPGTGIFQPVALVGVLSAVLAAIAQVGVRELTRTDRVASIVFYFGVVSTLVSLGPALAGWQTPQPSLWLVLLGLAVSGTIAQLLLTRAYSHAPAAEVGPFIYTSVVFAAMFDWLAFSRLPDALAGIGALLVIAAGVAALRASAPLESAKGTVAP